MKKLTLAILCLTSSATIFAADYKSENEKYKEMRKQSMEKHSQNNTELSKLNARTKELSQKLMTHAMIIEPKLKEIEADKRWEKLSKSLPKLINQNEELKNIFNERKAAYEQIALILHELDPQLHEQGKRTWEAKNTSQNI